MDEKKPTPQKPPAPEITESPLELEERVDCMNDTELRHEDAEILSELFRSSEEPRPVVNGNGESVLDVLYGQAVKVAEEQGWLVPSRAEFEEAYRQEIEKLRRDEMSAR